MIVPDEVDAKFLTDFKKIIESGIKQRKKFVIITGGGKTSRRYSETAKKLGSLNNDDLDWLGIHSTRLNAHLLRTIFKKVARPRIITNPFNKEELRDDKYPIIIAAGYKPGYSTDFDAVILARHYKIKDVLNLSNVDYVYDKDPKKFKNAKAIKDISWNDFRKLIGNKWDPGLNAPFDPVASRIGQKLGLKVVIMNGRKLQNLRKFLAHRKFTGTVIS